MRRYQWDVKPDIYIGDKYKRFVLGVSGKNPLVCFGINPSTADDEAADKTLHMVEQISKRNGFDGWIMFNVYPYRSANPECLPCTRNENLHQENLRCIEEYLPQTGPTVWAAWGNLITARKYLIDCLYDIYRVANKHSCQFIAFGKEKDGKIKSTTKNNNPLHPSRLPFSVKPERFDLAHYWPAEGN